MNMLLASLMFIGLFAVAVAHLIWALGFTWPIRNEKLLAQTVVGFKDIERMPPRLSSLAVAIGTFVAGCFALAVADHDSGGWLLNLVGLALAAVFLARGIVGYTQWWAGRTPQPNFRLNDRRVYSPLCLFIGIGFVILIVLRLV